MIFATAEITETQMREDKALVQGYIDRMISLEAEFSTLIEIMKKKGIESDVLLGQIKENWKAAFIECQSKRQLRESSSEDGLPCFTQFKHESDFLLNNFFWCTLEGGGATIFSCAVDWRIDYGKAIQEFFDCLEATYPEG